MNIGSLNIKKKISVDLNVILQFINIILLFSIWYSYFLNGSNDYIDKNTILLGTILIFQIELFLVLEKRKRDPFVLLLCFQMVLYFVLRILSLSIYPFSFAFERYPFTSSNLNDAIVFILQANLALYIGLKISSFKVPPPPTITSIPKKNIYILYVLIIAYLFTFSRSLGLSGLTRLIDLITGIFINLSILVLMIIVYIILFFNKMSLNIKRILIGGLLLLVVLQTLTGSRSAILLQINFLIITFLSINGFIRIRLKYILGILFLIPVMIFLFLIATYLRPRLENRAAVSNETFQVIKEFDIIATIQDNTAVILAPVFDRIGFLDYCAEIIVNSEKYESVFNLNFYSKSIIDNILTPGFDIFDVPKSANALTFIYNDMGEPKKSKVSELYQSDEFTFFGEMYALFGKWFSLVVIFLTGFGFKKYYMTIRRNNIFNLITIKAFTLYVFYSLLNSFGLDWVILDIVGIFFTFKIFNRFFQITETKKITLTTPLT